MPLFVSVTGLLGLPFNRGSASPVKNTPEQEAAENYLGKASKMDMANEAVYLQDSQQLLLQDRQDVARMKELKVFKDQQKPQPSQSKADEMGNIIVCDDYVTSNPVQPTGGIGSLGAIGIAAVTGLSVAGATWAMKDKPTLPDKPVIVATQPVSQQLDSEWDEVLYTPAENGQPEKVLSRTRHRSRSGIVEKKLPDGTWERVK